MYLWKVALIMSSGKEIHGYYESEYCDAVSVAKELMKGAPNTYNSIINKENTEQTLFKTGDVSAMSLSAG